MNEIIKIDESKKIKQSNRLIEARYNLTKYEQKMVIAICSQLDSNVENFSKIKIKVSDMAAFCQFENKKAYSLVKSTIMRLLTRTLQIKDDNGNWYATHWLQSANYIIDESIIEYKIDEELKPELLQLKAAYLSTEAAPLMEFNREYSARMYFILKKMLKIREFEYKLDFFRDRFQLGKAYKIFFNLKNKVLDPAISEINEKSDIFAEHEYIKQGRSYIAVRFRVKLKENLKNLEYLTPPVSAQTKLSETPEAHFTEEQQTIYDKLLKYDVSEPAAKSLVKNYGVDIIEKNIKLVLRQKNTVKNLGGFIIKAVKDDYAGNTEKAKEEARKRDMQRQEEFQRQIIAAIENSEDDKIIDDENFTIDFSKIKKILGVKTIKELKQMNRDEKLKYEGEIKQLFEKNKLSIIDFHKLLINFKKDEKI